MLLESTTREKEGQERGGTVHREKCGCHTASMKALADPMGSLEAGRPFRIFHVGTEGPGLHRSHQSLDTSDPEGDCETGVTVGKAILEQGHFL